MKCTCELEITLADRRQKFQFECPVHGVVFGGGPCRATVKLKGGTTIQGIIDCLSTIADKESKIEADVQIIWTYF